MVEGGLTVFDGGLFVVGERDADEHALEVRFRLQELTFAGLLGDVEVAPGAGHPVRALLEERVAAETVAEVVVLPGLPGGGGAVGDCVTVALLALVHPRVGGGHHDVAGAVKRVRQAAGDTATGRQQALRRRSGATNGRPDRRGAGVYRGAPSCRTFMLMPLHWASGCDAGADSRPTATGAALIAAAAAPITTARHPTEIVTAAPLYLDVPDILHIADGMRDRYRTRRRNRPDAAAMPATAATTRTAMSSSPFDGMPINSVRSALTS